MKEALDSCGECHVAREYVCVCTHVWWCQLTTCMTKFTCKLAIYMSVGSVLGLIGLDLGLAFVCKLPVDVISEAVTSVCSREHMVVFL